MRRFIQLFASGVLILGGGLVAIGAGLFAFISFAYLEWDAALTAGTTLLMVSAPPTLAGLLLILIGGALNASNGLKTACSALGFWLGVVGASLALAPLFNLIWFAFKGASFNAPGAPLSIYLGAMIAGLALLATGRLLFAATRRTAG